MGCFQYSLRDMGEGTVTSIVEGGAHPYQGSLFRVKFQVQGQSPSQVHGAHGVFESGVVSTRIDQISESQLLYTSQSLHLWCIHQLNFKLLQLQVTVLLPVQLPPLLGTALT